MALPDYPQDDYIAIEIDGGYPVLTLDLGSGQQKFTIHEKYVADDKWYKAGKTKQGRGLWDLRLESWLMIYSISLTFRRR